MSVQDDVARGVELLDAHGPAEWWAELRVDLATLDMAATNGKRDLVGQLYGDDSFLSDVIADGVSESFGLDAREWDGYAELTAEWRRVIENIRSNVKEN